MGSKLNKMLKTVYIKSIDKIDSTRSTERIKSLHGFVKSEIELQKEVEDIIFSVDESGGKEYKFKGPLNDKMLDISLIRDGSLKSALSIKFAWSNYFQNSINYFEQMVAESLNIKMDEKESYQLVILRKYQPYFSAGKKSIEKVEKIDEEYLKKRYEKFMTYEKMQLVDKVCLILVDYGDEKIIEKHSKLSVFDYDSYKKESITKINEEKFVISYPLVDAGIEKACNFEQLIKFIIN